MPKALAKDVNNDLFIFFNSWILAMPIKTIYQSTAVCLCLLVILNLVRAGMNLTNGMLVFTLDDPYIHLSVAEMILQGGYGVNVDEYASPSSSIIYPFLLAGTLALGLGDYGALLLNVLGAAGAAWIISGVFWTSTVNPKSKLQMQSAFICLPILLLTLNLYALPLTGMEHPLHVVMSMIVILGMYGLDRGKSPSPLVLAAIILVPLLRFEGVALSGAAIIALIVTRRFGAALIVSVVIAAALSSYVAYMSSLGLPILPSSVLVKSTVSAEAVDRNVANVIGLLISRMILAMNNPAGLLLVIGVGLIVMSNAISKPDTKTPWCLIGVSLAAIGAHLAAGAYGWFSRYEIYIFGIMFIATLIVWAPKLSNMAQNSALHFRSLLILFTGIATPYFVTTLNTPGASENIYVQQYQMHRFAVDYFPHPVALNDLGWVSYQNDIHVLDLWGLGSETARRMHANETRTEESIATLTTDAGSIYAMIYDEWFIDVTPAQWCHGATLTTPQVTAGEANVQFYLIDLSYKTEFEDAMDAFAQTLPAVSSLTLHNCNR